MCPNIARPRIHIAHLELHSRCSWVTHSARTIATLTGLLHAQQDASEPGAFSWSLADGVFSLHYLVWSLGLVFLVQLNKGIQVPVVASLVVRCARKSGIFRIIFIVLIILGILVVLIVLSVLIDLNLCHAAGGGTQRPHLHLRGRALRHGFSRCPRTQHSRSWRRL